MIAAFTIPISDPVIIFAVVMVVILMAPLLVQRFRLPGVVGLLAAGILLGPNLTGIIERDSTFQLLGAVGLNFIMFAAGLEIDLAGFQKSRNRSVGFGLLTFAIPQGLGTLMAAYVLQMPWPSAILLASLFASHTLLAYPVAQRLGLAKHEAMTVTIGGTMITDVLALLVLAVIARSTGGEFSVWFAVGLLVALGAFAALVLIGLPRLSRWYFKNYESEGPEAFVFVMASVFVSAWLAEVFGSEPIIGSFLAGLALNRMIPKTSPLMSRIHFAGDALFIPFFLVSVGMLADFSVLLTGWWAWVVSIAMCVSVVTCKWAAAHLFGLLVGYPKPWRDLIFGMSVSQAAATLAAVMVGYRLELFDDGVLNGAIMMIVVTCVLAPMVVERAGKQIASAEQDGPATPADSPQRIMIPLANPANAERLVELALVFRDGLSTQPVFPLAIAAEGPDLEERLAESEVLLSGAVVHAAAASVPTTPLTRVEMNVSVGILRASRDSRISHIIVGWDGEASGASGVFGRVLDPIVQNGRMSLMVARISQSLSTLQRVILLVPPLMDRGPGFGSLLRDVKLAAQRLGGRLTVVLVKESASAVKRVMSSTKPDISVQYEQLTTWMEVVPWLAREVRGDDFVALMSARRGTIAWDASLDRLPRELVRRLPDTPFVIMFPSELGSDSDFEPLLATQARAPDVVTQLQALDHRGAIDELAAAMVSDGALSPAALAKLLSDQVSRSAYEVAPGRLLVDLHAPEGIATQRILAHSADGVTFPKAARPVHTVMMLCSSSDRSSAAHLQELSRLAAWLRQATSVASLDALDSGARSGSERGTPASETAEEA